MASKRNINLTDLISGEGSPSPEDIAALRAALKDGHEVVIDDGKVAIVDPSTYDEVEDKDDYDWMNGYPASDDLDDTDPLKGFFDILDEVIADPRKAFYATLKSTPMLSIPARRALDFLEERGPLWSVDLFESMFTGDGQNIDKYSSIIFSVIDSYGRGDRFCVAEKIAEIETLKKQDSARLDLRRKSVIEALVGLGLGPELALAVSGQKVPCAHDDEVMDLVAYLAGTTTWGHESARDALRGDDLLNYARELYARRTAPNSTEN